MKQKPVLFALALLLAALPSRAQFLGDSLAAAGYNITEQEALDGMSALAAGRAPREVAYADASAPRPSENVTHVMPAPYPQPYPESSQPQPQTTVEPPPPPDFSALAPPGGTSAGFSGGGYIPTAADAEAWRDAFVPVGTTVTAPPAGSEVVQGHWGRLSYSKGVFYKQQSNGWVAVPAPVGAKVSDRPAGGSLIAYKGTSYIYYNGTFYVWNAHDGNAEIVQAPAGALVTNIPATAVKQQRDGTTCFIYGDVCFRPTFRGASIVYLVS